MAELRKQGMSPDMSMVRDLERKNSELTKILNQQKQVVLLDDEKIRKLEGHIESLEKMKSKAAFALPTPAKDDEIFGKIVMGPKGMRGGFQSLTGDELWCIFFHKILMLETIVSLRDEYRNAKVAAAKKREEEEKARRERESRPRYAPMERVSVKAGTKLKQIWWEPVQMQDLKDSIWEKIGFENSKIDADALVDEFDKESKIRRRKMGETKSRSRRSSGGRRNSNTASTAFDMKRSMAVGIAYQKLKHWAVKDFRTRLGDNDACEILLQEHEHQRGGLDREKVRLLHTLVPVNDDGEEYAKIRSKPEGRRSNPENLIKGLLENIPHIRNRSRALVYWYEFSNEAATLERTLWQIVKAATELEESEAFPSVLQMLRTIGNYLNNESKTMGQQYGFTMTSLIKFAEMRGNSKLTVLDFAIIQMKKFASPGLRLPEELESVHEVQGKDATFLRDGIEDLTIKVQHVREALDTCEAELAKVPDASKQDRTSAAFARRFGPWVEAAEAQCNRLTKLLRTEVTPRLHRLVNELMTDDGNTFIELISILSHFVETFHKSRTRVIPKYVPPPRKHWTPKRVGNGVSPPRVLLKHVVNSVRSFKVTRTGGKRAAISRKWGVLPPSTLPPLAKWVVRMKHLRKNAANESTIRSTEKKMTKNDDIDEGSVRPKSAPLFKLKSMHQLHKSQVHSGIRETFERTLTPSQVNSDATKVEARQDRKRELFPAPKGPAPPPPPPPPSVTHDGY